MMTCQPVTLVGTGRYGGGLIGSKYGDGVWKPEADLVAVVEPNDIKDEYKPYFKNVPHYRSTKDWANAFKDKTKTMLVDLALKPELIARVLKNYVDQGVRQFILPKPVSHDEEGLLAEGELIKQEKVKAAVASQEYYSELSHITREAIDEAKEQGFHVDRVKLFQCKERETIADTSPPLCEFPHEVQILDSTGLMDFRAVDYNPEVTSATRTRFEVEYTPSDIVNGVEVISDLDLKADTPSGREFKLEVFLDDNDPEADIIADYDVRFNYKTNECLKPGTVSVDKEICTETAASAKSTKFANVTRQQDPNNDSPYVTFDVRENKLVEMYKKIFTAMKKGYEDFQEDKSILTFENYVPLEQQVIKAEKNWKAKMNSQNNPIVSFTGNILRFSKKSESAAS